MTIDLTPFEEMIHAATRCSNRPLACLLDSAPRERPELLVIACLGGPTEDEAVRDYAKVRSEIWCKPDSRAQHRVHEFEYRISNATSGDRPTEETPEYIGYVRDRGEGVVDAERKFERQVETAMNRAADIAPKAPVLLVASELAFPVPCGEAPRQEFLDALRIKAGVRDDDRDWMIVAGSFHDVHRTWFNLVPVLCKASGELNLHPKVRTATKVGEVVRTPVAARLKVYSWHGMAIVPIVCLDSYDSGLVLSIAAENFEDRKNASHPFDLVVVPSMNQPRVAQARGICSAVSRITQSATLLVDSLATPGHALFRNGKHVDPVAVDGDERVTWFRWEARAEHTRAEQKVGELRRQLPWRTLRRGAILGEGVEIRSPGGLGTPSAEQ